ncbi:hypothetical protein U1Q18_008037 [Sarracenia purpurea var. burkii]
MTSSSSTYINKLRHNSPCLYGFDPFEGLYATSFLNVLLERYWTHADKNSANNEAQPEKNKQEYAASCERNSMLHSVQRFFEGKTVEQLDVSVLNQLEQLLDARLRETRNRKKFMGAAVHHCCSRLKLEAAVELFSIGADVHVCLGFAKTDGNGGLMLVNNIQNESVTVTTQLLMESLQALHEKERKLRGENLIIEKQIETIISRENNEEPRLSLTIY